MMSEDCSNCRNQMTGWDGGFFGLPFTCECRIYGETEGRKSCSNFKKRVTKSDLLNKIQSLEKENEQLKKSEKINMGYAEQIVEENQKLRIAKNDLRIENGQLQKENKELKHWKKRKFKLSSETVLQYQIMDNDTDLNESEVVDLLNKLYEENERLRNQLERKTILLKIRTKHMDDREKSFHELLNYLESFCYKSNIDGNYAKQDIINILNNWEIREYD